MNQHPSAKTKALEIYREFQAKITHQNDRLSLVKCNALVKANTELSAWDKLRRKSNLEESATRQCQYWQEVIAELKSF